MQKYIMLILGALFIVACEKQVVYEQDPRFFNDAFHGNIVGTVIQKGSGAQVIVNQEVPVDTTEIDPSTGNFRFEDLEVGNYDLVIIADNFRTYRHTNVQVQGAGTTYLGQIDLSNIPDLVNSYYPEDKAELVYNNNFYGLTISVNFSQPMDRESVEEAFTTLPETDGIFYWGQYTTAPSYYYFGWAEDASRGGFDPGATITTYSKISSFVYRIAQKDCFTDTVYNVTLSTAAMDTAGNNLRFPLEFSFSTIQSSSTLNGIQTQPYNGDVNVDLMSYNGIQITFPRNMNQSSTEESISMTPAMDPIFIWPAYNQLTIYTGGSFYADTTYQITIAETAEDLDGNPMGHPFSFSFETAPVGLESTYPRNGQLFIDTDAWIQMRFNTYILKSTVQNAFHIDPATNGTIVWGDGTYTTDKTMVTFIPSGPLKVNTKYTITLNPGTEDLFGTKMKDSYTFSFITRPE